MLEKDLEIKDTDKQRRKLVDYYNQRWEEKFWEKWHFKYTMRFDEVHLVSKKMWFIEWLVSKNKIEFREDFYLEDQHWWWFGEDEIIIMLLAIQENPISFLLSVLE